MTNPTIDLRCFNCGMPLAEGALLTSPKGPVCESCKERLPDLAEVCDFCGEQGPTWVYDAEPIGVLAKSAEGAILADMGEQWASCDACCLLALSDEPSAMMERVLALRGYPPMPEEHKQDFKEVLLTYFIVVLGALKRPPRKKE